MGRKFLLWSMLVWPLFVLVAMPRCAWAADLTLTNQVKYHHREVFVSLEGVPLARAILEIYRRALAPRSVSFLGRPPAGDDELVTIQFQGAPWVLQEMLVDLLDSRGYSVHTTAWGSDVVIERDIGRPTPAPPPPSPVSPGGGGGVFDPQ